MIYSDSLCKHPLLSFLFLFLSGYSGCQPSIKSFQQQLFSDHQHHRCTSCQIHAVNLVSSNALIQPCYHSIGHRNIWIRVDNQQPSYGRLGNVHNQPICAAERDGGGAGTNVPEGERHCSFKKGRIMFHTVCVFDVCFLSSCRSTAR